MCIEIFVLGIIDFFSIIPDLLKKIIIAFVQILLALKATKCNQISFNYRLLPKDY